MISQGTVTPMESTNLRRLILLTGATGYVGGELLRELEARGIPVRCMARRPEALRGRTAGTTEVVRGDVLDLSSLKSALHGVDTAYYLVHSMSSSAEFERQDRQAAANFAEAARACGIRRIIYLGGLGERSTRLSAHLRSRHEVGDLLRSSGVQTIELRSSIVIGCGSFSFEMIRALVERLPVMITPKWVATPTQPIAISDLLFCLASALDIEVEGNQTYEVGGPDRCSYGVLMRQYARERGLRRLMIPVPVLTPRLSSLWLALVTPYYARVGRKLVDGLQNPTVVRDDSARALGTIQPLGLRDSIRKALSDEDRRFGEDRWLELIEQQGVRRGWAGMRTGTRLLDVRELRINVEPERVFAAVERIGGETGWYYGDWLWQLRGLMDQFVGGTGLRRGRRDPEHLRAGDIVDFWRVEVVDPPRRLRLKAEMKVPGRAWLEFQAEGSGSESLLRQSAIFDARGLFGLAYWYLLYPAHSLIFGGMLRNIAHALTARHG